MEVDGPPGSSVNSNLYTELRTIPTPEIANKICGSDGFPNNRSGTDIAAKKTPTTISDRRWIYRLFIENKHPVESKYLGVVSQSIAPSEATLTAHRGPSGLAG